MNGRPYGSNRKRKAANVLQGVYLCNLQERLYNEVSHSDISIMFYKHGVFHEENLGKNLS